MSQTIRLIGYDEFDKIIHIFEFIRGKRQSSHTVRRVKKYLKRWGCVRIDVERF